MNDDMTTVVGDVFNAKAPIDITRGRKRKQSDNLGIATQTEENHTLTVGSITMEKAIRFFEEQVLSGQCDAATNSLYMQTALWLRQLMSKNWKQEESNIE